MPTISPIMAKMDQIAWEMQTSPKHLVKLIMLDPVLTAGVMRLVNSSFYGLAYKVQSLAQAVVLVGINTVKNLAISTAILSTGFVKGKKSPIHPEEFWRHCLATAIGCKLLAKKLGVAPDELETYFIAGLLHDVGKILFIKADPHSYRKALTESQQLGISLAFSELAHFGCSHSQAGGVLARQWKLDDILVKVIELHHSLPEKESSLLREVVTIANNLSKQAHMGQSGNCVIEEMIDDLALRLGIQSNSMQQIAGQLAAQLEKASDFLNIVKEQEKG
ncbi:MAG: HDOD domain-containing protein [bacterium]